MSWLNPLSWGNAAYNSDWDKGYDAANELVEVLVEQDHDITDEEARAQWDAVESGHSDEYVRGYTDYFKPWWHFW